jgi:restriction system protein
VQALEEPLGVREMWDLRDHHDADGVKIVCVGDFTGDAKAFAVDKAIDLIGGEELLALVRSVQALHMPPVKRTAGLRIAEPGPCPGVATPAAYLSCPTCGGPMARRTAIANIRAHSGDAQHSLDAGPRVRHRRESARSPTDKCSRHRRPCIRKGT